MRRVPIIPTIIVLLAVAIMVRLGFWQIDRLHQKEAMIARYTAALATPGEVAWPGTPAEAPAAFYRRSRVTCDTVGDVSARTGRNAAGQSGWAHTVACGLGGSTGGAVSVVLGWSNGPELVNAPPVKERRALKLVKARAKRATVQQGPVK